MIRSSAVPEISIIIINYNTRDLVLNCIASIFETMERPSFDVWLVDNGSTDKSVAAVKEKYPSVNIIENRTNLGFARANNLALKRSNAPFALLLNSDTILMPGAVEKLHDFMAKTNNAGIVCGQLLNQDGTKQNSFARFPNFLTLLFNDSVLNFISPGALNKRSAITEPTIIESGIGACMLIRKKAAEALGYFDEKFFFFFEETDLSYRLKQAQFLSYIVPQATIVHLQGQSVGHAIRSRLLYYESRYLYFKKRYKGLSVFVYPIVMARLLINTIFNFIMCTATLFFHRKTRDKLNVYLKLIFWHMKGCPKSR